MNNIDQVVQPLADALGDDARLLMSADAQAAPPTMEGDVQPEAIVAEVVIALAPVATKLIGAFLEGLMARSGDFKDLGASVMERVGNRLESLINRGDKAADRKEIEEGVTNAKKAAEAGELSIDDLTAAEEAIVEALKARGFSEEKAIAIASKVRGASSDLLVTS